VALLTKHLQAVRINEQYPVNLIDEIFPVNAVKMMHLDINTLALSLRLLTITFFAGIALCLKGGGTLTRPQPKLSEGGTNP